MSEPEALKVFIPVGESTCNECGHALGRGAWISLAGERGALCLSCADLDHLVFLPTADAALTRRARKHSALSAAVLKWSRARKRCERQGVLGELLAKMRADPLGGWTIDNLKTVADQHGVRYREGKGSHCVFGFPSGAVLSVPAKRPIKPIYILASGARACRSGRRRRRHSFFSVRRARCTSG